MHGFGTPLSSGQAEHAERPVSDSEKVANLKRARPTADNIDEVDDVKQTQKEPNNIKKSQKQKNAEEVDRLCPIDSSKDDGSGGLLQGEYPTTRSGRQSRAPDSGDLLRYSRFT